MVGSPRLTGLLQPSQKEPRRETARRRPRMEECLPTDVLEAILGLLDLETLCTARLVSRTVCAAASAHIRTLTLKDTYRTSLRRFPRLEHVAAHYKLYSFDEEESLAEIAPRLRDRITSLTFWGRASITETLRQVALMPKLRHLDLWCDVTHEAALLRRCTQLEALKLYRCTKFVATTVAQMTRLTSLRITRVSRFPDIADASWLEHATNLRNLRALSIEPPEGAVPLVGNLTGLTGLTMFDENEVYHSIAPLTTLTRLRSLNINWDLSESNLRVACSLGSGSLVNLKVRFDWEASADWGRYLLRQTALTRLVVYGWPLCNMRHIGALRIELLQSLELYHLDQLDAEGISALCKATSLTHLAIEAHDTETYLGLSHAVPRLPQLLSLELHLDDQGVTQPHMGLTQALARLTRASTRWN